MNPFNTKLQLKGTESVIENKLIELLSALRRFKFVTKLVFELIKIENDDKIMYNTSYLNSKADKIINESDIDNVLESIYIMIIANIQKSLGKGSSWFTDSVIDHNLDISK